MKLFDRWIAAITLKFSGIAQISLLAVMLLIVSNIILRRFFVPIPGTVEMVELLGALILGCSIAYCLYSGGHIFVDVLVQRLSIENRMTADIITNTAMFVMNSFISWQMFIYGKRMIEKGFATGHLGIPVWPAVITVALGFFLMVFVNLNEVLKATLVLYKGEER